MADAKKQESTVSRSFATIEFASFVFMLCAAIDMAIYSTSPNLILDWCVIFVSLFFFIIGLFGRRIYEGRIVVPFLTERIRQYKADKAALHEKRMAMLIDAIPDDIIRWRFFGTYLPESVVEEWLTELSVMAVRLERKYGAVKYGVTQDNGETLLTVNGTLPTVMVNSMRTAVRASIHDGMSNGAAPDIDVHWDSIIRIITGDRYGFNVWLGVACLRTSFAEYMAEYIRERQVAIVECV